MFFSSYDAPIYVKVKLARILSQRIIIMHDKYTNLYFLGILKLLTTFDLLDIDARFHGMRDDDV